MSRTRVSVAIAVPIALLVAAFGPVAPASAAKVKVKAKVLTNNQGQIWQARAARVSLRSKPATRARAVLVAGRNKRSARPIGAARKLRLKGKVRRVALKVSAAGRNRLGNCANQVVGVQVTAKPRKGKARKVRSVRRLNRTLGTCSVGSENPTERPYFGDAIPTPNADRCDLLVTAHCMEPWPSDFFTISSNETDTGRRLNLHPQSTPQATADPANRIDPTNWNRSDGFSPGSTIVVKVPEVETPAAFQNTGFVPVDDLARYDDPNQPVVLIDAETGERQLIWAELDSRPFDPAPGATQGTVEDVNLLIHPAQNLEEGKRYIVALRNLRDAENRPVQPPIAFRAYRDRLITGQSPVEGRRTPMEQVFSELQDAGIPRGSLYLAWDFTVASEDGISRWMLDMRDHALGEVLGDPELANGDVEDGEAPSFTVTNVNTDPTNPNFLRIVDGTLTGIPCYLEHATNPDECAPGAQLAFDGPDALDPDLSGAETNTTSMPYRCVIASSVTDGNDVTPSRAGLFGHGLLGSYTAVSSNNEVAPLMGETNVSFCAVSWAGFSSDDLGNVLSILGNMSNFPRLPDRVQQGYINFMFLGRAMLHSEGFNSHPAFQVDPSDPDDAENGGDPVFAPDDLVFEGISQGAVLGGGLTAVSPDISHSVLNVGGMRYSLLLPRSIHWVDTTDPGQQYEEFLGNRDLFEGPLLLSFIQTLWDRGETAGYAAHLTSDPYPDTPTSDVLLQVAFGDFQVSNLAAEVQARTMGMNVYEPALDPGRHWEDEPFLGIPPITDFPHPDSALVYFDGGPLGFTGTVGNGTKPPPTTNTAPRGSLGFGSDPHGYPRRAPGALEQIADFFDGGFGPCTDGIDLSTPLPCYANGWTGP